MRGAGGLMWALLAAAAAAAFCFSAAVGGPAFMAACQLASCWLVGLDAFARSPESPATTPRLMLIAREMAVYISSRECERVKGLGPGRIISSSAALLAGC